MCIMEVRSGQHASTIAQAMAHNVVTSQNDCEMFAMLLEARGDAEMLAEINAARVDLENARAHLLRVFGVELAHDVAIGHNPDNAPIGSERDHTHVRPIDRPMLERAAEIAATRARGYESR